MRSFLAALAFLTIVPVHLRSAPPAETVARSRFWFPVVSLILGTVLGLWSALVLRLPAPGLAAFLILLAWVAVTGALHFDGWCDVWDGLFGGRTEADRLQIMKDPHVGAFGLAAGVLLLLGKYVALQALVLTRGPELPWVVGAAAAGARCLALIMAAGARYPRPEGTGKTLIEATRAWEAPLFAGSALGIYLVGDIVAGAGRASSVLVCLVQVAATFAAVGALRVVCRRRLGGITGDCLGAAIELAEGVYLLTTALMLPPSV
jgi:cobalamin 5'-phosphate synthase/cobalamin synthase